MCSGYIYNTCDVHILLQTLLADTYKPTVQRVTEEQQHNGEQGNRVKKAEHKQHIAR